MPSLAKALRRWEPTVCTEREQPLGGLAVRTVAGDLAYDAKLRIRQGRPAVTEASRGGEPAAYGRAGAAGSASATSWPLHDKPHTRALRKEQDPYSLGRLRFRATATVTASDYVDRGRLNARSRRIMTGCNPIVERS